MADTDPHHGGAVVRQAGPRFLPMWPLGAVASCMHAGTCSQPCRMLLHAMPADLHRLKAATPGMHRRSLGDVLAQRVEKAPFNVRRNLLTAGYGALAVGPFGHAW